MNVPHTYRVTSEKPGRTLEVNSPPAYERFVAAVGEPTTEFTLQPPEKAQDPMRLSTLAAEHGIEPPGTLP
jgi:hypothetical protein